MTKPVSMPLNIDRKRWLAQLARACLGGVPRSARSGAAVHALPLRRPGVGPAHQRALRTLLKASGTRLLGAPLFSRELVTPDDFGWRGSSDSPPVDDEAAVAEPDLEAAP